MDYKEKWIQISVLQDLVCQGLYDEELGICEPSTTDSRGQRQLKDYYTQESKVPRNVKTYFGLSKLIQNRRFHRM